MAYFWSRLQISGLISLNNKYNPRLKQHSWHYTKFDCTKKNINEDYNRRSISTKLKRSEHYGLKKKRETRCFFNFQRASSTKTKKLTLWQYMFGPKRSSKKPCQLADQEQFHRKEDSHQATLISTDPIKLLKKSRLLVKLQPKQPPSYKLPRAALLSRVMVEGFAEGDCKVVTPTAFKKPYEEMRPASNTKGVTQYRENVRLEDVKPYEISTSHRMSTSINAARAHIATAKILRQAMTRKEPRMRSRIEQLKTLTNEETIKSQRASRILDSQRENSGD